MDQVWSNEDIYGQILVYLTSYERSKRCAVCKAWCKILRDITRRNAKSYLGTKDIILAADVHCYIISKCEYVQLHAAVKSGDIKMFKMISYKKKQQYFNTFNTTDGMAAFSLACRRDYIDMVTIMLDGGYSLNLNEGLGIACQFGHVALAQLLIDKGATYFNEGLEAACYGGQIEIVRLMIDRGATNFDDAMNSACYEEDDICYNDGESCSPGPRSNRLEIIKLLIEKGARNWEPVIRECIKIEWIEAVELMISCLYKYGKNDDVLYKLLDEAMSKLSLN